MPIYEYECLNCRKRTELLQRFDAGPLAACPECGGQVKKLISTPAFQFKGSGWYKTDYADKKSGGEESRESKESKAESKGDEAGKAEKSEKPEKKEAASESKGSSSSSGSSGSSGGTE